MIFSIDVDVIFIIFLILISLEEEGHLLEQTSCFLKGRRIQKQHWDNVITGYREVERHQSLWNPASQLIFNRVKSLLPNNAFLEFAHILELNAEGEIFPHVDNTEVQMLINIYPFF